MRPFLGLALVAACGHPAPAAAPQTPAPAPAPAPSDPAARGDLAVRFVRAVAARDRATEEALVDVRGFCAAALALKPDAYASAEACADQVGRSNQSVYPLYDQQVAAGATPGAAAESPIDASQGIYLENVDVAGSTVGVIVIDIHGRLFIVFPVKKGD